MARTDWLRLRGTVEQRSQVASLLERPGDAVLIKRGVVRLIVLSCPCGCGEEISLNLDPRSGPAWNLYVKQGAGVSIFPSIWRKSGCRSHFVVWASRIWKFDDNEDAYEGEPSVSAPNSRTVLDQLTRSELVHFSAMAERLDAIPWDVLAACRQLVLEGLAVEGTHNQRGSFRRK